MKTWEKIYWGIILGILALVLLGVAMNKGNIEVKKTFFNKTTVTYVSKGKFALYVVLCWLGFWGLIWLIVKALTGGFSSSRR